MTESLQQIVDDFTTELRPLRFGPPVTHVYNPLEYAAAPHEEYLRRYATGSPEAMFLGMNPGPWGMAQTGIPFGAIEPVRDWLGLGGEAVGKPENEHPKRPVTGFDCPRAEVSGSRLWGWARDTWGTPEAFFRRFFVGNYCPLIFLEESGRNLTPDKLSAAERDALLPVCDRALRRFVAALGVRRVIGVGAWARKRAQKALGDLDLRIDQVLHPSPASPLANRGWAEQATRQLEEMGFEIP
jgi:single-strand selective monofunctional uracil DNA glycosylase